MAPPSFAEGITFVEGNIFGAIVTVVAGIDGLAVGIGRSSGGTGGAVVGKGGGPDASQRRIGTIPIAINCISFGASCGAAGVIDVEGLGTVVVTGGGPAFGEESGTVVGEGGGAVVGTTAGASVGAAFGAPLGTGFGAAVGTGVTVFPELSIWPSWEPALAPSASGVPQNTEIPLEPSAPLEPEMA